MSAAEQQSYPTPSSLGGLTLSPWTGLMLGLVAGAVVWAVIESVHPVFLVPEQYHAAMGESTAAHDRALDRVHRSHAALYVGGLGFILGTLLGAGEAIKRRWLRLPLLAAPLGALGGAAGGVLGCLVYEYVRLNVGQAELSHTIAAQLLLGMPLGVGVGIGLGLATRGAVKTTLAGLLAGALAGVVYPAAVSIVLPTASTDSLLPDQASSRLVWLGILAGLIGLIVPIAGRRRTTPNVPASPS